MWSAGASGWPGYRHTESFAGVVVGFAGFGVLLHGVLRGVQDTRVPMIFALIGYWVVGIGVGTLLAFPGGMAGVGIWLGLASGLSAAALLLVARWSLRDRLRLLPT